MIKGYFVTKHYLVIKSYKSSQRKDKERNFIKEVLFKGANRSLKTREGQNARDILEKYQDELEDREY